MRAPLGRVAHARSGDKGGDANIGLWVPAEAPDREERVAWLLALLTPDGVRRLLPEAADLEVLVAEMREVGLDVRVDREGDPTGLPTTTQLAVYRIVQESLTNAWKHGESGTPVHAALTYRPDTVEITVVNRRADDGTRGPGTGHGLVGMRERVTMTGGSMTAGPRGDDFAVAVRMPAVPASGQFPRGRITQMEQERTR